MDVEVFYSRNGLRAANATRVCGACPVRAECREHAQRTAEPYGIWGGLTPAQRGWALTDGLHQAEAARRDYPQRHGASCPRTPAP